MKQQFRMKLECQVFHQLKQAPRNYTLIILTTVGKNGSLKIAKCFMKAGFGSGVSWDHNSQGNENP